MAKETGLQISPGQPADHALITDMMQTFYKALEMNYTPGVSVAVAQMLGDPQLGHIWLLKQADQIVGYATLSRWFSPELEGWTAYLDELYIAADFRGRGFGSRAIALLLDHCRTEGLGTLRLELEDWNTDAERLYLRLGFVTEKRKLMTRWLR